MDVSNDFQLMVYTSYQAVDRIEEEMLLCASLELHTRGIDVFHKVKAFFKSKEVNLEWRNCVGVSVDGGPSMLERVNNFTALAQKNCNTQVTHCLVHRQALVVKELKPELEETMNVVITMVIFIKCN